MLWIMIFIIALLIYFIVVKWNNIYSVAFSCGILSISIMLFGFMLCINIISSYKYNLRIEYLLYKFINMLSVNLFDIKTIVSASVCMYILSSVLLAYKCDCLVKISVKRFLYPALAAISSVGVCALNSKRISEKIYLLGFTDEFFGTVVRTAASVINNYFVWLPAILVMVNLTVRLKKTGLIFRKRYYGVIMCMHTAISLGFFLLLYISPIKFFFNNFDIYDFAGFAYVFGYRVYLLLIGVVMAMIVVTVFFLIKYDVLEEKSFIRRYSKSFNNSINVKDLRHVFHSYKNGMFSISAISDMALGCDNIDDMRAMIRRIKKCAGSYAGHISVFLDIYGNSSRSVSDFELTDCIISAEQMCFVPDGVAVVNEFETADDVICGDRRGVVEMFVNLIGNAVDAIGKKHCSDGKIVVRVWNEENDVCISVKDNGCGISKKNLKNIFVPFYTAKQTNKNWGLGLSHARNVAEFHNGHIYATSKEGIYTEFQIILPRAYG